MTTSRHFRVVVGKEVVAVVSRGAPLAILAQGRSLFYAGECAARAVRFSLVAQGMAPAQGRLRARADTEKINMAPAQGENAQIEKV